MPTPTDDFERELEKAKRAPGFDPETDEPREMVCAYSESCDETADYFVEVRGVLGGQKICEITPECREHAAKLYRQAKRKDRVVTPDPRETTGVVD